MAHEFKVEMFMLDLKEKLPHMNADEVEGLVNLMKRLELQKKPGWEPWMALLSELVDKLRKENLPCALAGIAERN